MAEYPKTFDADTAAPAMSALIRELMQRLLTGDHPTIATLRGQYSRAKLRQLELTGVGFYADFDVPSDMPTVTPASFSGGDIAITLEGVESGGGCVLHVRDGRLESLEGYVYGDETWPDEPRVVSLGLVHPVLSGVPVA